MNDDPRIGYSIDIPLHRWLTANAATDKHWRHRDTLTKVYRRDTWAIACQHALPRLDYVAIEAEPHGRAACRIDPGSHYPTVKACIDGLVDARKLADDTRRHIDRITLLKPQPATDEYLRLTIVQVAPAVLEDA